MAHREGGYRGERRAQQQRRGGGGGAPVSQRRRDFLADEEDADGGAPGEEHYRSPRGGGDSHHRSPRHGGGGGGGARERRQAPDGRWYERHDFIRYYGGTEEWDAAAPRGGGGRGGGRGGAAPQRRRQGGVDVTADALRMPFDDALAAFPRLAEFLEEHGEAVLEKARRDWGLTAPKDFVDLMRKRRLLEDPHQDQRGCNGGGGRAADPVEEALRLPFGECVRRYPRFAEFLDGLGPEWEEKASSDWGPDAPTDFVAVLRERGLFEGGASRRAGGGGRQEQQRRAKEKQCRRCGALGHVARNCTRPRPGQGGGGGAAGAGGPPPDEYSEEDEGAGQDAPPPRAAAGAAGRRPRGAGRGAGVAAAPLPEVGPRPGRRPGGRGRGVGASAGGPAEPVDEGPAERPRPVVDTTGHTPQSAEMIEELCGGTYQCLICLKEIRSHAPTWNCNGCWRLFHVSCIKQWKEKSGTQEDGESSGFRCPGGCGRVYEGISRYHCFCEKTRDPDDDGYQIPHSCGNTCGRKRPGCPHPCALLCHPGPCPPCKELGPERECWCGSEVYRLRCGEDDGGRSCGAECDAELPCGKHRCERVCHPGSCGDCPVLEEQTCWCGRETKQRGCCAGGALAEDGTLRTFSCGEPCGKKLDCGEHFCERQCHSGPCSPCELAPARLTTCPCGKRDLALLLQRPRSSCLDSVPTCGAPCGKMLPCGKHKCQHPCHRGPCGPCQQEVSANCRCGLSKIRMQCSAVTTLQGGGEVPGQHWPPRCQRRCNARKGCSRHRCQELCCPASRDAAAAPEAHICTEPCRRRLACRQHNCTESCHLGPCPPCANIVTEELTCACGEAVLEPPQPCGTRPPQCSRECKLERPCGHKAQPHSCHFGDCPICAVQVERPCASGHTTVLVPCHLLNPTCAEVCRKLLRCGRHRCTKNCHPGACSDGCEHRSLALARAAAAAGSDDEEQESGSEGDAEFCCGQQCGFELPCGHPCTLKCHDPAGPHVDTCKAPVALSCACGRLNGTMPCHQYYAKMRKEAGKRGGLGLMTPTLACDGSCARAKRLESIAGALGVPAEGSAREGGAFGTPLSTPPKRFVYSQALWDAARRQPDHVRTVEQRFAELLQSKESTLMLPAMHKDKRAVVHELAAYWDFDCRAVDPEPHRSCVLSKKPSSRQPVPSLCEFAKERGHTLSDGSMTAISEPDELAQSQLSRAPECGVVFLDLPPSATDSEFGRLLRPLAGRWIGLRQGAKHFCAVFFDPKDVAAAMGHLRRSGCSLNFKVFAEHVRGSQEQQQGPSRRARLAAEMEAADRERKGEGRPAAGGRRRGH
eukprot:TRINITY_DN4684_c7_g1_i1.p1 TRINITY_DN4684_c7_g1~~TRINITY_DN4684_c7_g1_i1.p1  ORF type:complete len:1346 (+),score=331.80 TRINITY_DN4684_c7_g1_i1:93-4040(+)